MKKTILMIAMAMLGLSAFAQNTKIKSAGTVNIGTGKNGKIPNAAVKETPVKKAQKAVVPAVAQKPDTSQHFTFNIAEAQLLFKTLEDDKGFYSLSDDISARKANTFFIPRADSIERILFRLDKAFQAKKAKEKAAADSLVRSNCKADSIIAKKKLPIKIK